MLSLLKDRLIALPRPWKRAILIGFDAAILSAALWASFALRLDRWELPNSQEEVLALLLGPALAVPVFIRMGLYRAVLRYLPERALLTIIQAVTLAVLLWVLVAFVSELTGRGIVPRSVPLIYWALATILIVGSRFAAKWAFWPNQGRRIKGNTVAIYGAGEAGSQLAMSLRGSHFVAAFLDDNVALHGREVLGIRVYDPSMLAELSRDFGVKKVILSIPSISTSRRKEIVTNLSGQGVTVQSLPGITDLVTGKYLVSHIKEIEIDDLLGRSSVPPDMHLIREMIVGRTIMVTGAGGSIGSELCRKIAQWHPQLIVLFEANEFALYRIDHELMGLGDVSVVPVLGSITDDRLLARTMSRHSVTAVFHAAAHKHVPLVEANALEGIRNNVFGTSIVVDAAYEAGVRDFVLISSDKAVRPTNVMGATKRWAELIVRDTAEAAARDGGGKRFCAVRFGNVLGSNGSVVPLFKRQIAMGGPVTLTDPAMTRYFMSIQEAAELIVQAGALSSGGDIFLLDMGDPVPISELAENMIRLAGLSVRSDANPDGDIEIVAVGKRPGEKLFEELFYDEALAERTAHPKIMKTNSVHYAGLQSDLARLRAALDAEDEVEARRILFAVINDEEPVA